MIARAADLGCLRGGLRAPKIRARGQRRRRIEMVPWLLDVIPA
jgi:hypothetical protein